MTDKGQMVLAGNDGGFGLPEARTYERDDGSEGIIPPDEIFMPPLRTRSNGWKKWHIKDDCGRESVYYIESPSPMRTSERYDWKLYCTICGHEIRWQDVLYVSETWYEDRREAKEAYDWRLFKDLNLLPEQVLELGTDPNEAELLAAVGRAWDRYEEQMEEWRDHFESIGVSD